MNIQRFLIKQAGLYQFIVLDVVVDGHDYVVSLGVGVIQHGQLRLSAIGEEALRRLADHADLGAGAWHIVEILSLRQARPRVRRAFQRATPGDALFFLCPDSVVYDAVFAQLNLQRISFGADRQ